MNRFRNIVTLLTLTLSLSLALACDDKGPLEQAAEEMDEAVQDLRAGEKTLGNRLDDSIDSVRDSAKDVKKNIEGR